MNTDYLIQQICEEIRRNGSPPDVASTVADVLVKEGLDIRREPSLEAMKRILVEAVRADDERRCVTC
jgi:hypothetical protein